MPIMLTLIPLVETARVYYTPATMGEAAPVMPKSGTTRQYVKAIR